jgi:hypothetical protein
MRVSRLIAAAGLAVTLAPSQAAADPKPVVAEKIPEHAIGVRFGFDPAWLVGVGYNHGWRGAMGKHDARLDAWLDAPVALIPTGTNWRAMVGATGLFHVKSPFNIALSAATGVATSRNVLGMRLGWLVEVALRPGYYNERGHVAADVGWRGALATRVWHSDLVRDGFDDRYPPDSYAAKAETGPHAGWYAFRSNRLRAGMTGGFQIRGVVGVFLGAGFQYVPQPPGIVMNAALGALPFCANIGMDIRWPKR